MSDWEGGRRQGIRWRLVGAVALVAAGIFAVSQARGADRLAIDTASEEPLAGPTEEVDVVVTSPLRAGDRWYCPSTHAFRAYGGRTYYPPPYPRGDGRIARPDECYVSAERAEAAGYSLAAPPANTRVIEGMYVEPTRSPSLDDCRELAGAVGFTVACPTRLPAPSDGPPCGERFCVFPGPDGLRERSTAREVGVVIQHHTFDIPPQSPWLGTRRDVVVTAVAVTGEIPGGGVRVAGPAEFVSCFPEGDLRPQGRNVHRTCVDARPWVPGFGGYPLEGHTSAIWRRNDVVYAAGVLGAGDHVDDLLTAVIDGIEYVDPP